MVFGDIVKGNARRYPNKLALVFENNRYTFKEFNERTNRLANALLDMGVKKGDRVAILLDNCHQYVEILSAGAKIGAVTVPLNCGLSRRELSYIINDAEANTLFLGENYTSLVNSIREELKGGKNFVVGTPLEGMRSYEELISFYPPDEPNIEVEERDLLFILYTSGTTGLPKGTMWTHKGKVEGVVGCTFEWCFTPQDVYLVITPAFWSGSLGFIFLYPFYIGSTVVILKEFDTRTVLETMEREKVTITLLLPPHISTIVEYPELAKYDLHSLRLIVTTGIALPYHVWKRTIGALGNIVSPAYGLSETGCLAALHPQDIVLEGLPQKVRRLQSCGQETINTEVRVVDEAGNDLPAGQVGEVIVRTDAMMKGYWKLPQATAEVIRGGYLYTGDLGSLDEEGYLYLMGRKKEILTIRGRNIYPWEVEEVLYRHPTVKEAAVVGVPHEKLGLLVKAFVALKRGKGATEEEIIDFCRQHLADYAVPGSVEFVDKLPRTTTGKVLKEELRKR